MAYISFPVVLSTYETTAQLYLKAASSMILVGAAGEDDNGVSTTARHQISTPVFVATCVLGLVCTVQSALWLRTCYRRFDTATMFPIEYGTLTMSTNLGGMLVFEEHTQMEGTDWIFAAAGGTVLCLGMGTVAVAKHRQRQSTVAPTPNKKP